MALQLINGNQISNLTNATIAQLQFTNTNSVLQLPSGTTAQRPTGVAYGTLRFNTTQDKVEVYSTNSDGQGTDGWVFVGAGGPHVGTKDTSYVRTNSTSIDENLTIGPVANGGAQFTNAYAAGPVDIASGFTMTIENGAAFYVIGEDPDSAFYENVGIFGTLDTQGAMIDSGATREKIHAFRANPADNMVNIDFMATNAVYFGGIQQNFNINILNFPTSQIDQGQVNNNKAYGFVLKWFNGDPRYRPTGTIMLNGSSIGNAVWSGGGPPANLTANRHIIVGLSIVRVTELTNLVGGTNTFWRSYLTWTEFA